MCSLATRLSVNSYDVHYFEVLYCTIQCKAGHIARWGLELGSRNRGRGELWSKVDRRVKRAETAGVACKQMA